MICNAGGAQSYVDSYAQTLRSLGLNVSVDISGRKISTQIDAASKLHIPFITVIGEHEAESKKIKIKNLETGKETEFTLEQDVATFIQKNILTT